MSIAFLWIALLVVVLALGGAVWWFFFHARPLCKLAIREGNGVGMEFLITAREITIGSEEGQTVMVSHPRVSRHHADLSLDGEGRFLLRDRSRQGIRVNGEKTSETALRSGDLISLADSVDLIFTRLG